MVPVFNTIIQQKENQLNAVVSRTCIKMLLLLSQGNK
jgi:hypothetical protein